MDKFVAIGIDGVLAVPDIRYAKKDDNSYYGLQRDNGAVRFLTEVSEKYEVVVVTNRPKSTYNTTRTWLRRNLGLKLYENLVDVVFTLSKPAVLFDGRDEIEFFVDDTPEDVLEAQKLGITAFSWAQPWNEEIYPKVFVTRDGYTMYQQNEHTDPVYFWGEERE